MEADQGHVVGVQVLVLARPRVGDDIANYPDLGLVVLPVAGGPAEQDPLQGVGGGGQAGVGGDQPQGGDDRHRAGGRRLHVEQEGEGRPLDGRLLVTTHQLAGQVVPQTPVATAGLQRRRALQLVAAVGTVHPAVTA